MQDTKGLDALATLCGYTAAATSEENSITSAGAASNNSVAVSVLSQQQAADNAMVSLLAQQQQQIQQQQQAQQALQYQQVQHVLTMRRATAAQQQQQQLQQQMVNLPSQYVDQAQQLERLLAVQVQQQQPVNAYGQGLQALAAQLLVAQQQYVPTSGAPLTAFPGSATLPQFAPSSPALSLSPAVTLSAAYQAVNSSNSQTTQISSPSTLAMPPPPSKVVPTLPLSNYFSNCTGSTLVGIGNTSCKTSSATMQLNAASKQPPIHDIISEWEDKKQAKRAANRLSAHLSRKRKKVFMEDLKDENSELRRKEQILRSIPDLIVVFDSSGLISFVSHSVTRFMNYTVEELEETSFWDKLSEESVRLIKSAFMDSLAVKRNSDEDCTPLVNGESIPVTLIQKDDDEEGASRGDEDRDRHLLVSLKGVVHFGGEYPECVCSIRPEALPAFNVMNSATNDTSRTASTTTCISRKRQDQESDDPALVKEAAPSHQVSDIESEKS